VKFRIYYGDGTTYEGDPFDAPRLDVQVIVQPDPRVGYALISSADYYYWEPELGGWKGTTGFGLYDHLIRCRNPLVLFGRHMTDEAYAVMLARIRSEMGDKQGWLMTERRPDD
jgi:hypothetical protein